MRASKILVVYVGRQFLLNFLGLFAVFLALVFLIDLLELMRRAATKPDASLALLVEMAALKLPYLGSKIFPFAVLFGGMMSFWRLTRSNELVVVRAAGVSAWQFLTPALIVAAALGAFQVAALSPLSSTLLTRYERLDARFFQGQADFLAISRTGLWLRQANEIGQSVIHSRRVVQDGDEIELFDVTIFAYRGADSFLNRIDAKSATLEDGFWRLREAWLFMPEEMPRFQDEAWFETDLTVTRIQDSFAPPETMSFWDLSKFIDTLDEAGFSATRHRLYWHELLATPLLLCAMILIAATFTLRHGRRTGAPYVIAGGVLTGFLLYFFSDVIFALGLSDAIPVVLAAWTPSGVSTLLGLAMLLHLEDG